MLGVRSLRADDRRRAACRSARESPNSRSAPSKGVSDVTDLAEARLLLARACLAQNDADAAYREADDRRRGIPRRRPFRVGRDLRIRRAGRGRVHRIVVERRIGPHGRNGSPATWNGSDGGRSRRPCAWRRPRPLSGSAMRSSPVTNCRSPPGPAIGSYRPTCRRVVGDRAPACARKANAGGAKRAAAAGLRILADHQQTLGATELRVGATAHAERLARLGLRLALRGSSPAGSVPLGRARPGERSGDADGAPARRLATGGRVGRTPPAAVPRSTSRVAPARSTAVSRRMSGGRSRWCATWPGSSEAPSTEPANRPSRTTTCRTGSAPVAGWWSSSRPTG